MPTWRPPETIQELGQQFAEMMSALHDERADMRGEMKSMKAEMARLVKVLDGDDKRPSIGERLLTTETRLHGIETDVAEIKGDLKTHRAAIIGAVLAAAGAIIMYLLNIVVRTK